MPLQSVLQAFLATIAGYLLLLAPGQAWWRGYQNVLPNLFCQVCLSVVWTSCLALLLAIEGHFSLPLILLANAAFAMLGFLYNLLGRQAVPEFVTRERDRVGPILVLLALCAYWPAYPTFYGSGDSTMYVTGGIHLAQSGGLSVEDPIPGALSPALREQSFGSVNQFLPDQPPYSRTAGGLLLEKLDAEEAWPAFFPLPTIWSGILASVLGPRAAPGFAPLFAALALWPIFLVSRRLAPMWLAVAATLGCALNGASYYFARFAMSEPIVTFFLWTGIAALAAWEDEGRRGDLQIASLGIGAAILTRPEFALVLAAFLALRSITAPRKQTVQAALFFWIPLSALLGLSLFMIREIPGAYMAPILEPAHYYGIGSRNLIVQNPGMSAGLALSVLLFAAVLKRARLLATATAMVIAFAPALANALSSRLLVERGLTWTWLYVGSALPVLALIGSWSLWRRRHESRALILVPTLLLVVASVLLWNPHVNPVLPWAGRRLVPALLPCLFVLAAAGLTLLAKRNLVAAALALLLCCAGVQPAGHAVWGHDFFAGSVEDLERLNKALPKEGMLAINVNLGVYMFDTPLWLLYGRPSLIIPPERLASGRQRLTAITSVFAEHTPLYYLTRAEVPVPQNPLLEREKLTTLRFGRLLLEQTYDRVPVQRQRYLAGVALFQLKPKGLPGRLKKRFSPNSPGLAAPPEHPETSPNPQR